MSLQAERNQLGFAVIVILWVSALVSSFIDNIPFTTAMVRKLIERKNFSSLIPIF